MSVSDRVVQALALLAIKQHGATAACYAAERADELLNTGAVEAAKTWRLIMAEIERLQAILPDTGTGR